MNPIDTEAADGMRLVPMFVLLALAVVATVVVALVWALAGHGVNPAAHCTPAGLYEHAACYR